MKAKCCITFIVLASMLGWVAVTVSAANGAGDGKSRGAGGSIQSHSGMSIHHARQGDAASEFKVANIVILNNTGLPDSDIYFNLINTVRGDEIGNPAQYCPPQGDWDNLFQWYGGTVGGTNATQIVRNGNTNTTPVTTLSYNVTDPTALYGGWSGVSLKQMRGSVLSNASSNGNPPTSSSPWWGDQTYSSLNLNNYPTTDTTVKGQFPTISMGLLGACTFGKPKFAGRIAISAKAPYTGDLFDRTKISPPYLLIEGSIFPTDNNPAQYATNASNLDLSFVEQISIAADMELWAKDPTDNTFKPYKTGWLAGTSLTTLPNTMDLFSASLEIQKVKYQSVYDLCYAFTKKMVPDTEFKNPYTSFLADLIKGTTASLNNSTTAHPVVKVAGVNIKIGSDSTVLEFGDCTYGYQHDYDFSTYFVDMSLPASSTNWAKILNWYKTDSTTPVVATPSDPTPYFSTNSTGDDITNNHYMLMLGTFLPGSDCSLSPFPLKLCPGAGGGPLSIQLNQKNTITICDATDAGQCNNTAIQTLGLGAPNPINGIFGNTNTLNGPLGINFYVTDPAYILNEFDLSVGKTTAGTGTLEVDLVNVNGSTSTNLVRVSIDLSVTPNEGSASAVMKAAVDCGCCTTCTACPDLYDTGFNPTSGWPLQINWKDGTCKYNGTPLLTTAYAFSYWDAATSNWVQTTNSNASYIAACTLNQYTIAAPTSYKLNIQGDNLTVALTNGAPVPTAGSPIAAGTASIKPGSDDNYTNGNNSNNYISEHNNAFLLNQITLAPAKNATSFLHLLAVSETDLLATKGLAGNNPNYRFLRWNTDNTPPSWEEAFGTGDAAGWPTTTTGTTGLCPPSAGVLTFGPPQSGLNSPVTTQNLLNNISGRVEGDICAAFSYGMVNSTKTGNDFNSSTFAWPANSFPPKSTAIGALTTQQYFQLIGIQPSNDGTLPVGKNLTDSTKTYLTYDPYVDLGVNHALSNCYFSGFGDRFGSFGGFFNPNPTFLMDSSDSTVPTDTLRLGNVPGTDPISNNTVIVITLHKIHTETAWDTIDSDLDNDFDTDSTDLSLMLLAMSVYPPAPETGSEDLNKDGVLDNTDLGLVFLHFGD